METVKTGLSDAGAWLSSDTLMQTHFQPMEIPVPKGELHPIADDVLAVAEATSTHFVHIGERKQQKATGTLKSANGGVAYLHVPGTLYGASLSLFGAEKWQLQERAYDTSATLRFCFGLGGDERVTVSDANIRCFKGRAEDGARRLGLGTKGIIQNVGLFGRLLYVATTLGGKERLFAYQTDAGKRELDEQKEAQLGSRYHFTSSHILLLEEEEGLFCTAFAPETIRLKQIWKTRLHDRPRPRSGGIDMVSSISSSWLMPKETPPVQWGGESESSCAFRIVEGEKAARFVKLDRETGALTTLIYDPSQIESPVLMGEGIVASGPDGKGGHCLGKVEVEAPLQKKERERRQTMLIAGLVAAVMASRIVYQRWMRPKPVIPKPLPPEPPVPKPLPLEIPPPPVEITPPKPELLGPPRPPHAIPCIRVSTFPLGPAGDPHYYLNRGTW